MKKAVAQNRIRLAPVLMTMLFVVASLKAAGLWVNLSAAGAEEPAAPIQLAKIEQPRQSATSEKLLEQLNERRIELDAREADLDTREQVLAAAELRLENSIKALQQEKEALAVSENNRARAHDGEIGRLSDAYERMKARDAARVFEVLDGDILIPVAAGMRTQSLAAVLAEMAPEKAKALTVALANRDAETGPAPESAE